YESPPIHTIGRDASSGAGPPTRCPATTTAAVPRVGSRADPPGHAVEESKTRAEAPTAARPAHPTTTASRPGIRGQSAAPSATPAPSASSHRRVVVTKKAAGFPLEVIVTDQRNEGTAIVTSAAVIAGR